MAADLGDGMTRRVVVRKHDDVWAWHCPTCSYFGWTRLGFHRALDAATSHRHWIATEALS